MLPSMRTLSHLKLTLFTSKSCTLCVPAKEALVRIQSKVPFQLDQVDIYGKGNKVAKEKYKYDIPVVELNGREIMKHRIDEEKLIDILNKEPKA